MKTCHLCGRQMQWRKSWQRNWDRVLYCSDACRRARRTRNEGHEERILALLGERGLGTSICPSEILAPELRSDSESMERVRQAARRLANEGRIEITQKGRPVDPANFKGPIRLRLIRHITGAE